MISADVAVHEEAIVDLLIADLIEYRSSILPLRWS